MKLTHLDGDEFLLSDSPPEQAALHGLLGRIRDLNLTLISVTSGCPFSQYSQEEVKPS